MDKVRKFFELDSRSRILFLEAYLLLGISRIAISTIRFKRLVKSLSKKHGSADAPLNDAQLEMVRAIGMAIHRAAVYTPWESACLVQALTAQRMLSKRGIGGVLYLGAMMDHSDAAELSAHAWVKCDTEIVTGKAEKEDFAPLLALNWRGNP